MVDSSQVVQPKPRLSRTLSLSPLLLAICLIALAMAMASVEGSITGDQPPSSGDWVIRNPTVVSSETITLSGGIVVEANLTVDDSVLRMMPSSNGSLGINVTAGGRLVVTDTLVTSGTDHAYDFLVTGEMVLDGVTVEDPYLGIRVITDEDVLIANTTIRDPINTAILLEGADGTVLRNVRVRADDLRHRISRSTDVHATHHMGMVVPGLVRVWNGAPSIEGLDISINGTLWMDLGLVKKGGSATMQLLSQWPMLEVWSQESLVLSDVVFHDSTVGMELNLGIHNEVAGGTVAFTNRFQVMTVLLYDYRSIELVNPKGLNITRLPSNKTTTDTGLPYDSKLIMEEYENVVLVVAEVDGPFTTKGPHAFDLTITGARTNGIRVLEYTFHPFYSGTQRPSFDASLILDGAQVHDGRDLIKIDIEPAFTSAFDRFHSDLRISNSTFFGVRGWVLETLNVAGPSEVLVIENCTFSNGHQAPVGLLNLSLSKSMSNNLPSRIDIRRNVFNDSRGQLISVNGPGYGIARHEQLSISENLFINNSYTGETGFMVIASIGRVVIENNTFEDNFCSIGILVSHQGGYALAGGTIIRDPCDLSISENKFVKNTVLAPVKVIEGFIEVIWGGQLTVEGNEIEATRGIFLNLSEITVFSRRSALDFLDNDIHDNDAIILYFHQTDENHSGLSVRFEGNRAWDNAGPLTDYPKDSPGFEENSIWDYDARFEVINNSVSGSTAPVFIAYGNLTAHGNTFANCAEYALLFENLRMSQPSIVNNTFTGCGNVISITAKDSAPTHVLLWMDGNQIDCSGVALFLRYMELTMRNTNISSTASPTVVAEISKIDAYNCQLDPERAVVDFDGYIHFWFWVKARVEWANATGVASGNPVPGANVTFFDKDGQWAATEIADANGMLGPVTILQWYIEHTFDPVVLSPFKVVTSLSSFHSESSLELNRSYVGKDALLLLLVDAVSPYGAVNAPSDGERFNVTEFEVLAQSEDSGSGIFRVNMTIEGFASVELPYNSSDRYEHIFKNVPEGQLVVRVTFFDAALNNLVVERVIEVDATPPVLLITSPVHDMLTNASFVMLTGMTGADATLTVNMQAVTHVAGEFDHRLNLTEGLNTFEVLAEDGFGNTALLVLKVTRDSTPPVLTVSAPRDQLWLNVTQVEVVGLASGHDVVLVSVHRQHTDIIDLIVPTDEMGHFTTTVELEEGTNVIVITAHDLAGNEDRKRRTVMVDVTPPSVEIVSPPYGTLTNQPSIDLELLVSEDTTQLYVNLRRVLSTGTVVETVTLSEGENLIVVRAIDEMGNEAIVDTTVFRDTEIPGLTITHPGTDGLWTNDPVLLVSGTVDKGAVRVTVMDQMAKLTPDGFSINITLPEDGTHRVVVKAEDQAGNIAQTSFLVHLSTLPPLLLVSYDPSSLEFIDEGYVRVYGTTTEDVTSVTLVHESDGDRETVTVPLVGNSFTYTVTLVEGDNLIKVRVVDMYGNTNSTESPTIVLKVPGDPVTEGDDSFWTILAVVLLIAIAVLVALIVMMGARTTEEGPETPDEPSSDDGE